MAWVNVEEVHPEKPVEVCVIAEGWRSIVPLYLNWDGTQWIGLQQLKREHDNANIFWNNEN